MGYIIKYDDSDDNFESKELRFSIRSSAEDEAEKLREYGHANVVVDSSSEGNTIGSIIHVLGILVIFVGVVVGLVQGITSSEYTLLFTLYWWISSLIAGMMLIGFAEIIKLLDQINKKMKKYK